MKSFGQYFKYHFKSTFLRFVIMMAIVLTISLLNYEDIVRFYTYETPVNGVKGVSNVSLHTYTIVFVTLCVIMPIFELFSFKNRRNLDTLFALPVSRGKMLIAHMLNGLIHIITAFVAEGIIIFTALFYEREVLREAYLSCFFGYFFSILGLGIVMYLFFAFIFSQGNTVIDGIIFMVAWMFAFALPFISISSEIHEKLSDFFNEAQDAMIFFSPFDTITSMFSHLIETEYQVWYSSRNINYIRLLELELMESQIGGVFWAVIGVISAVLLYFYFKKQRAEKTEDISNSPIGYKFLIPFYAINLIIAAYDIISVVMYIIIMLIAYIVYRRTFRIKKCDLIIMGITIVIGIAVCVSDYIAESTRAVEAGVYLYENIINYISL